MDIAQRHRAQASLEQITPEGQRKLYEAKVLIVGMGALGSAVAEILCRAGVRELTLYDYDIVDETNLQRQSLYTSLDLGKLKVEAAKERLLEIDPQCIIKILPEAFGPQTRIEGHDLVIDGTDSLQARLLLNDSAKRAAIPLVIGTASGATGMVFVSREDACWQCITRGKRAEEDCASGVLGGIIYTVASVQATAAIQILLGAMPKPLLEIDLWSMEMHRIGVKRNPDCAACKGTYEFLDARFSLRFCADRGRLLATPNIPATVDLEAMRAKHEIIKDYGSAVIIALGEGTVLLHRHGAMEFTNVDDAPARRFASDVLQGRVA